MPGMDGYETAALIRSRRRTASTPIVFLTAIFRDEAHVFQAYSAGAVDVVFKPVDPFILKSKVGVLIDLHLKTEEVRRQSAQQARLLIERERMKAEKALTERKLRQAEARQAAILRSLPIIFHSRSADPPFTPTFLSGAVKAITGFEVADFLDQPELGSGHIHPDDLASVVEAVSGAVRTGAYACQFRWLCADGRYRTFQDQGVYAPGRDGAPGEILGSIVDITERRHLEEQLAHARKMEAVGQLTGGVAHDFNNLLTVILGNADMLAERDEAEQRRRLRVDAMRQAAERGRALTRQLLAFARRQHLEPQILGVNDLIADFAPLIRQAVGEGVSLEVTLDEPPQAVNLDRAQFESALLNLAVNARDAMPEGGRLSIATRRVEERWIEIEVRDSGVGMSHAVSERAFEPFFSTKGVGVGSGLGLSQVYGFVSQSGGEVRLETAPGEGAAFRILLPASPEPAPLRAPSAPTLLPLGGSEVVLIVEDDPSVLALAVEVLRGQGYQVLTAQDANQALDVLKRRPEVQLLFSDVVMPGGVSGVGLARQAQQLMPGLKVLLTSGFVGDPSHLTCDFPLIDKPYEGDALAGALRKVLDDRPPGDARRRRRARSRATA
jgi:signal transduction histidine kinase